MIRGNVDSLMKLVAALDNAGIELINPGNTSVTGGRGVRLKEHIANPTIIRGRQPKSTPSSRRAMAKARWVSDSHKAEELQRFAVEECKAILSARKPGELVSLRDISNSMARPWGLPKIQ